MKSFHAIKKIDSKSTADSSANKFFDNITVQNRKGHDVGTLRAEGKIELPNIYFSALVQLTNG